MRMRNDGQATPRLPPKEDVPPGEEEPWLFRFDRCLTTHDMWRMGFSRVIIFGAQHWTSEATAAAEISEALGASVYLKGLGLEHRASLEEIIKPALLGGDVLLAVQCSACASMLEDERAACMSNAAKLIDAISNVWTRFDEMGETSLGAVVIVMEGANWRISQNLLCIRYR
jgi:hypothetical protein